MAHNTTEPTKLGGCYTMDEFAILDPMRHKVDAALLRQEFGAKLILGCMEKWTRGEDIRAGGCFVRFKGELWLEVTNGGGGANTTVWLKEHAPDVGWVGSEGKPDGFYEAPMVAQTKDLRGLGIEYDRIWGLST